MIELIILDWIERNYGLSERENPCYNIKELAKEIEDYLKWKGNKNGI